MAVEGEGGGQRPNRDDGAWGRCDLQEFRVHENRLQRKALRFFSEKSDNAWWRCLEREAAVDGGDPLLAAFGAALLGMVGLAFATENSWGKKQQTFYFRPSLGKVFVN